MRWVKTIRTHHLPPSAYVTALYVWHRSGVERKGDGLVITRQKVFQCTQLSPNGLRRGLNALEEAGLISTTRGAGKGIRVTILDYGTYDRKGVRQA